LEHDKVAFFAFICFNVLRIVRIPSSDDRFEVATAFDDQKPNFLSLHPTNLETTYPFFISPLQLGHFQPSLIFEDLFCLLLLCRLKISVFGAFLIEAMCHDMRRFERMAEEKRRHEMEPKIGFIINEPEGIAVTPETKPKKAKPRRLLSAHGRFLRRLALQIVRQSPL
jgi:hypothetical protein